MLSIRDGESAQVGEPRVQRAGGDAGFAGAATPKQGPGPLEAPVLQILERTRLQVFLEGVGERAGAHAGDDAEVQLGNFLMFVGSEVFDCG